MEAILGIIAVLIGYFIVINYIIPYGIAIVITLVFGTCQAIWDALMAVLRFKNPIEAFFVSFSENVTVPFKAIFTKESSVVGVPDGVLPVFQVRVLRETRDLNDIPFEMYIIQAKGSLDVPVEQDYTAVIHIFDVTEEASQPVLCAIEHYQEENSTAYQLLEGLGKVPVNCGWADWVTIGNAFVDSLEPPHKGVRQLKFSVQIVPESSIPNYRLGFLLDENAPIVKLGFCEVELNFNDHGYRDRAEYRKEAEELGIKLAFGVAYVDGNLDSNEAEVIKLWANRVLATYTDASQDENKRRLNDAIKQSYEMASKLTIEQLVSIADSLKETASNFMKYEIVELCLDVMSADGIAEESELSLLDKISNAIGVDPDKFRALQDKRLTEVEVVGVEEDSLDRLVGITSEMDVNQIRKHLTSEYRKWNSRVTSGDEKVQEKAKEMILLIGEARQRHLEN